MDWLQALVLAVVQGITEFLPISSSAHLILLPQLVGWADQGLAFDVAVHVGTLAAVMVYFRATIARLLGDWLASLHQRRQVGESGLAWYVIVATVPVVLAGLAFADYAETVLRSPLIIAATTIGFGVLLWVADRYAGGPREEGALRLRDAVIIGLAQAVAIIPGTSRSGITMTAGLFLGMTPTAAARFSFLLSIPTITLAGAWKGLELLQGQTAVNWTAITVGTVASGVAAYLCITAFLALLDRLGMGPFVAYRLLLGGALLVIFL